MTKTELIDAISKAAKLTKADAGRALEGVIQSVVGELKKGGEVRLTGFGTFSVRGRAARTGRNPQTGEEIKIKARKSPAFKAGKDFKEAVN